MEKRGKKERSLILTEGPIGDGGEDHWEDTRFSVDICWQAGRSEDVVCVW